MLSFDSWFTVPKPRLFAIDMAVLSLHAYGDHHEPLPPGWKEIPDQELGSHKIPTIYPGEQGHAIGFNYRVRIFRHEGVNGKNNLIALAVRGTDITISSKILDNIMNDDTAILFQKIPDLYYFTRDIAAKLREKYPNFTLVHTGHSLGAAVASLVAATNGETAIIFDSPGVQGIVEKNSALKINSNSDITIYQSTRNIVNTVGRPLAIAKVKRLQPSPELESKLKEILKDIPFLKTFRPMLYGILNIAAVFIRHTLASHSIENMVRSLRYACHETYTVKKGDCLIKIAKDKYGDEKLWPDIYARNKLIIGNDSNFIKTGINITIAHPAPKKELLNLNNRDLLHALKDKNKDVMNTDKVEMCLSHGIDVDANTLWLSDKNEALHAAAEQGSLGYLKLMLEKGAFLHSKNKYGQTPLHSTVRGGNAECFKFLLREGASIDTEDYEGNTPLHAAASSGNIECVELLVKKGAFIHAKNNDGSVPLHAAAYSGDVECVEFLVKQGSSVHTANNNNKTPLHYAAQKGAAKCVNFLLEKRSSVLAKTTSGKTPLHAAASRGSAECLELLIKKGAPIGAKMVNGDTPWDVAASNSKAECLRIIMLKNRMHVDTQDKDGNTSLHIASRSGETECLRKLLTMGASVNAKNKYGQTPLHVAAENGNTECLKLLLKKGACVEATDNKGNTPLDVAACKGKTECLKLLLEKNAPVDAEADRYQTPVDDRTIALQLAAATEHPECVTLLLNRGADIFPKLGVLWWHRRLGGVRMKNPSDFFNPLISATFLSSKSSHIGPRTYVSTLPQDIVSAGILLSGLITSPLTTNGLQVVAESWVETFKSVKSLGMSEKLFGELKNCLVLTQEQHHGFNSMSFDLAMIDRVARLPGLSLMGSPVVEHIKTQLEVYQTQISCFEKFIKTKDLKLEPQSISFMGDLKKVSASLNNSRINFGEITQAVASLEHGMRKLAKLPEVATGFVEHLLGDLDKVMSNPLEIAFSGSLKKDITGGFQFAGTLISLTGNSELAGQITAIGEASITVVSTLSDLISDLGSTALGSLAAGPFAPFVAIGGALKTILGVFGKLFGGGGPSQEVKILEQIGKQITQLTQRMDARFDRIEHMLSAGFERIEGMLDTIYKQISHQFKETNKKLDEICKLNIKIIDGIENSRKVILDEFEKQNQDKFDRLKMRVMLLPRYRDYPESLVEEAKKHSEKMVLWATVDRTLVSTNGKNEKVEIVGLWKQITRSRLPYNINALAGYASDPKFGTQRSSPHLVNPAIWVEAIQNYQTILIMTSNLNITWDIHPDIDKMREAGLRLKKFILDIKSNSRLFEHLALQYKHYVEQVFELYKQSEQNDMTKDPIASALAHVDAAYGIWISFAYLAFAENTQKKSALMRDIMTFELWTSADLVRYLSPQDKRLIEGGAKTPWITSVQENAIKKANILQEKIEKKIATGSQEICAIISDTLKELDIMENVFGRKQAPLKHRFLTQGKNEGQDHERYSFWRSLAIVTSVTAVSAIAYRYK